MNKEQFKEYLIIFKKFLDSSKSLLNKYWPLGNMAYVFNFYTWAFIDTPLQVNDKVKKMFMLGTAISSLATLEEIADHGFLIDIVYQKK
jgi:hypothetical protein